MVFWLVEPTLLDVLPVQKHFKPTPTDIFLNIPIQNRELHGSNLLAYPSPTANLSQVAIIHSSQVTIIHSSPPIPKSLSLTSKAYSPVPSFRISMILVIQDLFTSHMPFSLLPKSIKNCKIVYINHDPKDTFISLWHFKKKICGPDVPFIPFDKAFEGFCDGSWIYGPIWDHQMEYKKESLKMPEMVVFLEFEQMKAKPEENVKKIAEFMGKCFTEEEGGLVEEIVKLCSFKSLKELEVSKEGVCAEVY